MMVDEGKYYLYRHIRPDKNEPFYIGIGTIRPQKTKYNVLVIYERAYTINGRNKIWNNIVKKNSGNYKVEILLHSDNMQFIKQKEIEFINLYGKIINKNGGILSNLSSGGEGAFGLKHTKEQKEKARVRALNMPQKVRDKISKTVSKVQLIPIFQYDSETGEFIKEWEGIIIASKTLNISKAAISQVAKLKKNIITAGGFMWRFFKKDKIEVIKNHNWRENRVYQYDLNWNLINVFNSIKKAGEILKIDRFAIYECTSLKRKTYKNYYWISENKIEKLGIDKIRSIYGSKN